MGKEEKTKSLAREIDEKQKEEQKKKHHSK
jgi:hypothetical protein